MLFAKKIHRNALEHTNYLLTKDGRDTIKDFPMGWREEEGNSTPIEIALGKECPETKLGNKEDLEFFLSAIFTPGPEAMELWTVLFVMGFYRRYNLGRLYMDIPTRRQRIGKRVRAWPDDVRERWYRFERLLEYIQK